MHGRAHHCAGGGPERTPSSRYCCIPAFRSRFRRLQQAAFERPVYPPSTAGVVAFFRLSLQKQNRCMNSCTQFPFDASALPVQHPHRRNEDNTMRQITTAIFFLACAASAFAQAAPAAQPSVDDRIKALEERIIALEGQVRMLKSSQAAPTPGPTQGQAQPPAQVQAAAQATATHTETTPAVSAPAQAAGTPIGGGTEQAGNLPIYGGASAAAKALNPDISVIGDFIGAAGHNPVFPSPSFQMHESEVGLQAIIDPYARGDFFISFGERGVDLEEGYITFTALPAGLVVRGGKMRAAFGKVNTLHNHVLPWIDRPLVTNNLVGGEDGIDDAGLSLTRIFAGPKGLFLEGTGQVFRGDSDELFQTRNRSDLSVVGHFRGYRDISESTNLDVGASYSRGHSAGMAGQFSETN